MRDAPGHLQPDDRSGPTEAELEALGVGGAPLTPPETAPETAAMARVESFLGELRGALVELAQRPATTDVAPLAAAVRALGERVEHGVVAGVREALDAAAPRYVEPRADRGGLALLAVAFLVLCWAAIFWLKTGDVRLALGTVVVANVLGCCLLAARR